MYAHLWNKIKNFPQERKVRSYQTSHTETKKIKEATDDAIAILLSFFWVELTSHLDLTMCLCACSRPLMTRLCWLIAPFLFLWWSQDGARRAKRKLPILLLYCIYFLPPSIFSQLKSLLQFYLCGKYHHVLDKCQWRCIQHEDDTGLKWQSSQIPLETGVVTPTRQTTLSERSKCPPVHSRNPLTCIFWVWKDNFQIDISYRFFCEGKSNRKSVQCI